MSKRLGSCGERLASACCPNGWGSASAIRFSKRPGSWLGERIASASCGAKLGWSGWHAWVVQRACAAVICGQFCKQPLLQPGTKGPSRQPAVSAPCASSQCWDPEAPVHSWRRSWRRGKFHKFSTWGVRPHAAHACFAIAEPICIREAANGSVSAKCGFVGFHLVVKM